MYLSIYLYVDMGMRERERERERDFAANDQDRVKLVINCGWYRSNILQKSENKMLATSSIEWPQVSHSTSPRIEKKRLHY